MKMKRNDNSGFTLLELIITIAIMSIVVVFSVSMFGTTTKSKVKSAAQNVDDMITSLRTKTIAKKAEFRMEIWCIDEKVTVNLIEEQDDGTDKVIKTYDVPSSVKVYGVHRDDSKVFLESGTRIELQCSKTNGRFVKNHYRSGDIDAEVKSIVFEKGDTTKTIRLVTLTGKHFIE